MIGDETRREVAAELRKQAEYCGSSLSEWWKRLQDTVTVEADFVDPKATFRAIADFIDCPTCEFKPAYGPDVMGKVSLVECTACAWTIEPWNAYDFRFCPNCGAMVTKMEEAEW